MVVCTYADILSWLPSYKRGVSLVYGQILGWFYYFFFNDGKKWKEDFVYNITTRDISTVNLDCCIRLEEC